jgi:hypothetical protein
MLDDGFTRQFASEHSSPFDTLRVSGKYPANDDKTAQAELVEAEFANTMRIGGQSPR